MVRLDSDVRDRHAQIAHAPAAKIGKAFQECVRCAKDTALHKDIQGCDQRRPSHLERDARGVLRRARGAGRTRRRRRRYRSGASQSGCERAFAGLPSLAAHRHPLRLTDKTSRSDRCRPGSRRRASPTARCSARWTVSAGAAATAVGQGRRPYRQTARRGGRAGSRALRGPQAARGLATSAAAGGASERAIMAQTGHRSTTWSAAYIREANLFAADNAASLAGPVKTGDTRTSGHGRASTGTRTSA